MVYTSTFDSTKTASVRCNGKPKFGLDAEHSSEHSIRDTAIERKKLYARLRGNRGDRMGVSLCVGRQLMVRIAMVGYILVSFTTARAETLDETLLKAEQGDDSAQYNLGVRYGQGVEQDYDEAYKWFVLAAQQGYVNAQQAIYDYAEEAGVVIDVVEESAVE